MAAAQDLLDSYKDVTEDNDILKRARHMMSMAASMQNFTRGEGKIKTTQDFFTAAEFFAEESNRLYKLIRMFSYIVPMGEDKRVLMQIADHIPRHCGQMQLLIQMPGVSHLLFTHFEIPEPPNRHDGEIFMGMGVQKLVENINNLSSIFMPATSSFSHF